MAPCSPVPGLNDMISCDFHPIRKALHLSLNEMAVLKEIYELSNNTKYGGWCVKSRQNLANTLDLSKSGVNGCVAKLELMGYIEKDLKGRLKPTDIIREIGQEKDNFLIAFRSKDSLFISGKMDEILSKNLNRADFARTEKTPDRAESDPKSGGKTTGIGRKVILSTTYTTTDNTTENRIASDFDKSDPETFSEGEEKKEKERPGAEIRKECIEIYHNWLLGRIGVGFKGNSREGKAMNNIIAYLSGQEKIKSGQFTIQDTWRFILDNWNRLDGFYGSQINLSQIDTNLVNIMAQIKTPRTNGQQRTPETREEHDRNLYRQVKKRFSSNGERDT